MIKNKMEGNTLVIIKNYLRNIKPYFIDGSISLIAENGEIKIIYTDNYVSFTQKEKIIDNGKEAILKVVDFCFNCYFDYERTGTRMKSNQISNLLMISDGRVRGILKNVYDKIRKNEKQFL